MKLLKDFFQIVSDLHLDSGYMCRIKLNPEHFIFKAHFPGNPITPGVCITQMVTEILENKLNHSLKIKSVKNIKFLSVIVPSEHEYIDVRYSKIENIDNLYKVQVSVETPQTQFVKLSIVYS